MGLRLAGSRTQAAALIEAGLVVVGGAPATKASRLVAPGEPIRLVAEGPRFVSRGGEKLQAALEYFGVDPTGKTALDAGASTGGFTDCLLRNGAASVVAVDVGRGQLHQRLREDPRVRCVERTDIRSDLLGELRGSFAMVVADLSFIGLRSVAGSLVSFARPDADMVILVKPQFEAGRVDASRARGVIRDPAVWRSTLDAAIGHMEDAGATMIDLMVSPLRGTSGNVEFLTHFKTTAGPAPTGVAVLPDGRGAAIDDVVSLATAAAVTVDRTSNEVERA